MHERFSRNLIGRDAGDRSVALACLDNRVLNGELQPEPSTPSLLQLKPVTPQAWARGRFIAST
jgi:hypothetical protein